MWLARAAQFLLALALCSCTYRPGRFADAAIVTRVSDDAPSPVPRRREYNELVHVSDVYLRRPLFDVLAPNSFPFAGDANALDDVPPSSWFRTPASVGEAMHDPYAPEGPPVMPLMLVRAEPFSPTGGLVVLDARGIYYELRRDSRERPEMRTAAASIASNLARAFGLNAPGVWVTPLYERDLLLPPGDAAARALDRSRLRSFFDEGPPPVRGAYRVGATRWPVGIDIGITPDFDVRTDDPNDLVPHHDRRTLRGLKVLAAWLGLESFSISRTRDTYVGEPGRGHVVHYLLGLEDALGASAVVSQAEATSAVPSERAGGFFFNLVTLGLAPDKKPTPTQQRWLSIGAFGDDVPVEGADSSPPYSPFARASAEDGYWAAKRIAAITSPTIVAAVDAGAVSDPSARRELIRMLESRRQRLISHWFGSVTPCELVGVRSGAVRLRDEAVARGYVSVASTRYSLEFIGLDGQTLAPAVMVRPAGALFDIPIPRMRMRPSNYLVMHFRALRSGVFAPRHCDVHVVLAPGAPRVVGIQH